jgi:ATP-dependent helicase HrpA
VTVHIPLPLLNQVEEAGFEWQIPGLRRELIIALIKSLPKPVRRNFVPRRTMRKRFWPGDAAGAAAAGFAGARAA